MKNRFNVFAAIVLLIGMSTVFSQETNAGFHEHDGFYLSMATGVGTGTFSETHFPAGSSHKLEMQGGVLHSDIKVGGAVWRNKLILSGDLIDTRMRFPDTKLDGTYSGNFRDYFGHALLGLGVTYYFMPVNFFLSGTIGVGGFKFMTSDSTYDSKRSLGLQLKVGKEWWVSKDWGLGVSLFLLTQEVKQSNNQNLKGGFLGLMFNTTFN